MKPPKDLSPLAYIILFIACLISVYFGSHLGASLIADAHAETAMSAPTKTTKSEPCECISSVLIDSRGQISQTELYSCYCRSTNAYLYITSTPYSSEFRTLP